jgi:hypothetical protein
MESREKLASFSNGGITYQSGEGFEFPVYQGRASQYGYGFGFPVYQGRATQYGSGFGFPVFQGMSQYGTGIGDIFRGILRFFKPIAMKGAQTLLKAGSEAIKDGATVKDVLTSAIKPTIGSVLSATADRVAEKLVEKPKPAPDVVLGAQVAPPPPPPPPPQSGSGKRKSSLPLYKTPKTKNESKAG